MASKSPSTRSSMSQVQVTGFVLCTALVALMGCILIALAVPFVNTVVLGRRIDNIRVQSVGKGRFYRAIAALHHYQPLLAAYPRLAVEAWILRLNAYAADDQYDAAADAAHALHDYLSAHAEGRIKRSWLPSDMANGVYLRITSERAPGDPWMGYRELVEIYRESGNRRGMRAMLDNLERNFDEHPWQRSADRAAPSSRAGAADRRQPAVASDPAPASLEPTVTVTAATAPGKAEAQKEVSGRQWALPVPDGAIAYNSRRDRLREVPAGTLVDIHEHTVWDEEPMVRASVFVLNRWVPGIFLRAARLSIQAGCAKQVTDQERELHTRRLRLVESIAAEEKRVVVDRPPVRTEPDRSIPPSDAMTADAPPPAEARRQLAELNQRIEQTQKEMHQTEGPRRAELIDELRRMGLLQYRLRQAAAGVVETLRESPAPAPDRNDSRASSGSSTRESPRLQNLRRELEHIDNELERLAVESS